MHAIEIKPAVWTVLDFQIKPVKNIFLTGKAELKNHLYLNTFVRIVSNKWLWWFFTGGGNQCRRFNHSPVFPVSVCSFYRRFNESGQLDAFKTTLPVLKYNTQRFGIFRNPSCWLLMNKKHGAGRFARSDRCRPASYAPQTTPAVWWCSVFYSLALRISCRL